MDDHRWMRDKQRYGGDVAKKLAIGHLLPILDGLDERPVPRIQPALQRIASDLVPNASLIVTCRTEQFQAALESGYTIPGAAFIEPELVRLSDALAFLRDASVAGSGI